MGARVGAAARADVLCANDGRSEATRRRSLENGFRDVGSVQNLVEQSDVILSICPPAIAEDVARTVATAEFDGLFVEANAIAPARAQRIAVMLSDQGAVVVDATVISLTEFNLYLAGEATAIDQVTSLFAASDVNAIQLNGGVGTASALKMAFSCWNKIGIALAAQAFAIARAYDVYEPLVHEHAGVDPGRIVRAGRKAWRWGPEMNEVAETCADLGLPTDFSAAAATIYERWSHHHADMPLARLLEELRA